MYLSKSTPRADDEVSSVVASLRKRFVQYALTRISYRYLIRVNTQVGEDSGRSIS